MYQTAGHPPLFRRPALLATVPQVVAAESTRHGGVSAAPYATLNLGKSTGDNPVHVAENRRRLCTALGFSPDEMAWSRQVHGIAVLAVGEPGGAEGYDALITDRSGILLAVSVADCTPILIYDRRTKAMAAIHAGWRGAAAGIVRHTVKAMALAYGTRGSDCLAYVGTCIGAQSFEVGPEVADSFDPVFHRYLPEPGKYLLDLKKVNASQLDACGVPANQIELSEFCTVQNAGDYFSHRREKGVTGRMLAVIGRRE